MRTPWRFVADLVSRKPKADRHDEPPAVAPKTIALEYKLEAQGAHPAAEATDAGQSVEPHPARVEDATPAPWSDQEQVSEPVETAAALAAAPVPVVPVHAPTAPVEAQAKPAPTRANKIAPITEPESSEDDNDEAGATLAAGPKSILHEMAQLDADVAELRRQLTRKLAEQNAQLRKMLARFDAR